MLSAVVLQLDGNQIKLIAGRRAEHGKIDLFKTLEIEVSNDLGNQAEESSQLINLETLIGNEIISINAVLPSGKSLYRKIQLPFNDQKKIEQVAPLQLQDLLPFDVEEFILESKLTNAKRAEEGYNISCSLTKENEVKDAITLFEKLGINPQSIYSHASSIAGLSNIIASPFSEYAIASISENETSIVAIKDNQLIALRELLRLNKDSLSSSDIEATLRGFERDYGISLKNIYVISNQEIDYTFNLTNRNVNFINLSDYFHSEQAKDKYSPWAYGILSRELSDGVDLVTGLVDYRIGKYAYKPFIQTFILSLKEELFAICLMAICGFAWLGANYWGIEKSINVIENKISELVKPAIPEASLPYGREVSFLETKITDIEDQLKSVGSFGALSPLEILKAISETVTPGINIQIDALTISQSRVTFRGTVPDNASISTLSTALTKNDKQFCNVNVEPKGKAPGTGRVNFSAEVEICG